MNALQKIAHAKAEKASILDLSEMALTELPKSIGDLIHLKQLNLSKNNLQRLPSEIGKLKNLERLNAWSNSLQELPRELGSLKNLKQLDLEDNHLIEIPRAVFELTALRILDVEHNTILEIPDEIQKLSALQQLDISRNKLQKVNARIGKLTYLSVLNLKGNLLRELPRALCDMRRLRQLSIEGNFLEEALVEASFEGQKAVQRYFREKYILDKIQEAKEKELIKFYEKSMGGQQAVIAGNSIGQDRLFINKYFKEFASKLHYRVLDVSAWKIIFEGMYDKRFEKSDQHRAIDDIKESLAELKFYLEFIKIP